MTSSFDMADPRHGSEVTFHEVRLRVTCESCPEQYDAFVDDRQVGYLRMRHNRFAVYCPHYGDELVFETTTGFEWTTEEREAYLEHACSRIRAWLARQLDDIRRNGT